MILEDVKAAAYNLSRIFYIVAPYIIVPIVMGFVYAWLYNARKRWIKKMAEESTNWLPPSLTVHDLIRNIVSARIAMEKFVDENFPVGTVVWIEPNHIHAEPKYQGIVAESFDVGCVSALLVLTSACTSKYAGLYEMRPVKHVDDFEPWVVKYKAEINASGVKPERLVPRVFE